MVGSQRLALLAALATVLSVVFAGSTDASNNKWNKQDFRLREAAASLGPVAGSQIVFSGTMSQQAYSAGLAPQIEFNIGLAITCHPDGDAAHPTTYTGSYSSR